MIIRPALEKETTQAKAACTRQISLRTVQRWIKNYREQGLTGLVDAPRADKGTSRKLPRRAIHLIEGLAEPVPPPSVASIHCQVTTIATEQYWKPSGYARVCQIIKSLPLHRVQGNRI